VARKKSAASTEPKSGRKESKSKGRKSEKPKSANTLADKLERIGVSREQDLVLHLPLRYEDRTHLCPLGAVKVGQPWQVEGTVVHCDIQYRGRRQLVCLIEEGDAQLVLRFFHFYPSQHKALAPGKRVRAFGDVREGTFGLEMIHPGFQIVDIGTPLPDRLTPVYPTTAGLAQDALRKLVRRALVRDPAYLGETLPPWTREPRRLWGFAQAIAYLHDPPTDASQQALDERVHPAWTQVR
jgi:ATP-dependent DNA helicase RecG